MPDLYGMDVWPKREVFSARAKAYQSKTGKTQAQVALALEISLPTYRNYLYGSKKPGFNTLQKSAALFGCSVTEFVDDPNGGEALWPNMTEEDRVRVAEVMRMLQSIPEAQRDLYIKLWKQGIAIGLSLIASEETEKP